MSEKTIHNPVTKKRYKVRTRSTKSDSEAQIEGLWSSKYDKKIESELGCIGLMEVYIKQSEERRRQDIDRINNIFKRINLKFFEGEKVDVDGDDYIQLKQLCKELGYTWFRSES